MNEGLVLVGILVAAVSGAAGLPLSRRSAAGQWLSAALAVLGSGLGLAGCASYLFSGQSDPVALPWAVPGGPFTVALDDLSALFLVPVFLISLLGSVYGLGYWKQADHPENGRKLRLFYGLLTAGMALLVIARNGLLFLASWELMALAAFFLVTTEDREPAVREAGWLYLAAAHVATLCLFAVFALLRSASGSFALAPLADGVASPGLAAAVFLLALAGFGLKAGIMPLHVWLPSSHANAPSHVSAILSGVILKMGVYGLVRICSFFPHPPVWWGGLLLGLGIVSGVLGVAFAIGQHDLKRLLAYHSIENIGIIVMGVGLALLGRSLGRIDWVLLGLGGALLHVWNHALFKSLLFLSAGSVIHTVHTREIDHLGGLARRMPWTALCFLVGAVAICGLPPLNGFVSELLVYLGLFRTLNADSGPSFAAAAFAAPALALIGALALACFVKVLAAVFLGEGRTDHVRGAREAGPLMLGPMIVLAACCALIGLLPACVVPALQQAVTSWAPEVLDADVGLADLAPFSQLTGVTLLLVSLLAAGALLLVLCLRRGEVKAAGTWDCGFAVASPRVQYTASSFAQMLVGMFAKVLRPRTETPEVRGLFPGPAHFHSEVPDTVLDRAALPAFGFLAGLLARLRILQQGSIQLYVLYVFLALIGLLLWR
jgi:hydrogenase-4 component B